MLERFEGKRKSALDDAVARVLIEMQTVSPESKQYSELLDSLERLVRLRREEKSRVSPDTLVVVGGNLLVVLVVVAYERTHVVVTRALNFMLRTKLSM